MKYEEFSVQCKTGIEQFKNWISNQIFPDICDDHAGIGPCFKARNLPFKENSQLDVNHLVIGELFVSTLIINGASLKEANEALKFADKKCFWRKDVFYKQYQGLGVY